MKTTSSQRQRKPAKELQINTSAARQSKVSKGVHKTATVEIAVKRLAAQASHLAAEAQAEAGADAETPACSHNHDKQHDIRHIAQRFKQRLADAVAKVTDATSPPTLPRLPQRSPSLPPTPPAEEEQQQSEKECTIMNTHRPSRLRNLELLKQYLYFVSQENAVEMDPSGEMIKMAVPVGVEATRLARTTEKEQKQQQQASLGARLIEAQVHGSSISQMASTITSSKVAQGHQTSPLMVSRRTSPSSDRRRPGRPPKQQQQQQPQQQPGQQHQEHMCSRQKHQPLSYPRRVEPCQPKMLMERTRRRKRSTRSGESVVQCICYSPCEESGAMVQCDDCARWLHLDCLQLTEDALDETFRCPACFVSLGGERQAKLVSSVTWRFAARQESVRRASLPQADDDDELMSDDGGDHARRSFVSRPLAKTPLPQQFPMHSSAPRSVPQPTATIITSSKLDNEVEDMLDDGSETESDSDIEIHRRASTTSCMVTDDDSSTTTSVSEAGTPEETTFESPMMLDESVTVELLSRLALRSLDATQKEIFSPNASDVFLCETTLATEKIADQELLHPSAAPTTAAAAAAAAAAAGASATRFTQDTLPSSICAKDLTEFSFDHGPFWRSIR